MISPLVIIRPLLNWQDLYRWGIENGIDYMLRPENLHVTLATARKEHTDWMLAGDPLDDIIEVNAEETSIMKLGIEAWCLVFSDMRLTERFAGIREAMKVDYPDHYHAHVTLYRGQTPCCPSTNYKGKLIFGPEEYRVFEPRRAAPKKLINKQPMRELLGMPLKGDLEFAEQ